MLPQDPSVLNQVIAWAGGLIGAMGAIIFKTTHSRIKRLEADKADQSLVLQHGANLHALLIKLDDHIKDEQHQFGEIFRTMHEHHIEVIRELGKKEDRHSG